MGSFIARQPNGLYCRFSTIIDCPTDWNLTEDDYIELCAKLAREDAVLTLEHHVEDFSEVKRRFNVEYSAMNQREWNLFMKEVNDDRFK